MASCSVPAVLARPQLAPSWLSDHLLEIWSYLAIAAIAVNAVLVQTMPDVSILKNGIRVAVLGSAVVVIWFFRVHIPVYVALTVLSSAALLVISANPDQLSLVFVLVMGVALSALPRRRVERAIIFGAVLTLALIFVFLATGLTQNVVHELRSRATLGTESVPFVMNVAYGVAVLSIMYAFRYRLRLRLVIAIAAIASTTGMFLLTDGRGGFAAVGVFVLAALVMPIVIRFRALLLLMGVMPIVFTVVSVMIAFGRESQYLNKVLSDRPELYARFLDTVNPVDVLLSTSVKQSPAVHTLDNSYIHLLIGCGLVAFLVVLVVWYRAIQRLALERDVLGLAFLGATALYCMSESILLRPDLVFIVYFWCLLIGPPAVISNRRESVPDFATAGMPQLR